MELPQGQNRRNSPLRSSLRVTLDCHPQGHAHGPRPRAPTRTDRSVWLPQVRFRFPPQNYQARLLGLPTGARFPNLPSGASASRSLLLLRTPHDTPHQPHPQLRLSRPRLRTPAWAGAPRSLRGGGLGAAGPSCLRWVSVCQRLRFGRLDYVSHRTWGS